MKRVTLLICIIAFMFICIGSVFSEEKVTELNWYSIRVQEGSKTEMFFGTSDLSEIEMMTSMKNKEVILLNDLVVLSDKQGQFIVEEWTDFLPMSQTRVFINAEHIIYVLPLKGHPKDFIAKETAE